LHRLCIQVLDSWSRNIKARLSFEKQAINMEFVHGDAAFIDWHDADVVFMNASCFGHELMTQLSKTANKMRSGTFVITTTVPLRLMSFELVELLPLEENWGNATAFVYRKL